MKANRILIGALLVFVMTLTPLNYTYGYNVETFDETSQALEYAVEYLRDLQNDDGGFPARRGRDSSIGVTCWSIMALVAAGEDVESSHWENSGNSPLEYILSADNELEDTLEYARILLALSAAGSGTEYMGENIEETIVSFQQANGHFEQPGKGEDLMINSHMWSILALESAGNKEYNREKAKAWLLSSQNDDGGFGWLIGGASDSDDTGVAIQALILLGEDKDKSMPIENALKYIKLRQESDGGFSSSEIMGDDSNVASDAWVMQGLIAADQDYESLIWSIDEKNVKTHILSLQNDDGSFDWKKDISSSPVKMTANAISAISEKPYPVNIDYSELKESEKFSDLDHDHWANDSIIFLVKNNVLNGYPDGTFKPEGLVKRAEFTSMAVKGLAYDSESYANSLSFNDIDKALWSYKYVAIAYKRGIINGRSVDKFDPDGLINGAELATMLVNSIADDKKEHVEDGQYWYSGYVALADEYGLLYPEFKATEYATRAQCAYSIKKIIEFVK